MFKNLTYKPFGEKAILIEWKAKVSEEILQDIVRFKQQILEAKGNQIFDCVVGYHSLTILYSYEIEKINFEIEQLKKIYKTESKGIENKSTLWKIPVCYDASFGIDLEVISKTNNLSIEKIIKLHIDTTYTVYFIGFLPGFLYLGGLHPRLHTSRKATPRITVEKGSVAIGGSQTGVYPQQSAGGWNIIGNTPIPFFDVNKNPPCFARSGDKIQFKSIDIQAYKNLDKEVKSGEFNFKTYQENG